MIFLSAFKTMVVFLKECFEKVDFEGKKSASDKRFAKLPSMTLLCWCSFKNVLKKLILKKKISQ